jgi:hypothetical protein
LLPSRIDVYYDDMFGFSLTLRIYSGSVCNVTVDVTTSKTDWSKNRGLSTVSDRQKTGCVRSNMVNKAF